MYRKSIITIFVAIMLFSIHIKDDSKAGNKSLKSVAATRNILPELILKGKLYIRYYYDTDKRLSKLVCYGAKGKMEEFFEYEYVKGSILNKVKLGSAEGLSGGYYGFTDNDRGRIVSQKLITKLGETSNTITYEYSPVLENSSLIGNTKVNTDAVTR